MENNIGSINDIKVMVSEFLPDDTMIVSKQTFEKLKKWYGKMEVTGEEKMRLG